MHFPGKAQASAVGSGVDIAPELDLKTIDFPGFALASGLPDALWQVLLHLVPNLCQCHPAAECVLF